MVEQSATNKWLQLPNQSILRRFKNTSWIITTKKDEIFHKKAMAALGNECIVRNFFIVVSHCFSFAHHALATPCSFHFSFSLLFLEILISSLLILETLSITFSWVSFVISAMCKIVISWLVNVRQNIVTYSIIAACRVGVWPMPARPTAYIQT